MSVKLVGLVCRVWGCWRPHWKDGLCSQHWRLRQLTGADGQRMDCGDLGETLAYGPGSKPADE